jgi:hypothetical protein
MLMQVKNDSFWIVSDIQMIQLLYVVLNHLFVP